MTRESPVYTTHIECPVCKTPNDFEALKLGAYTEADRDTDFCPTGRVWRNPEFQKINPLAYSMATCGSCFYTRELDGNYKNWQRDVTFKMYRQKALREAHLKALAEPNGILRRLGEHLDLEHYPHETAVNKLLLGIFDEKLHPSDDGLNVARFLLRIAWLYREQGDPDHGQDAHLLTARRLRDALSSRSAEWEAWLPQLKMLADDIGREYAPGWDLAPELTRLDSEVTRLVCTLRECLTTDGASEPSATTTPAYYECESHFALLQSLRETWREIPLNEQDAIAGALEYYLLYFKNARSFPSPESETQTSYLIAELARRAGQTQVANDYFNHAIRSGQQLIHELRSDPPRVQYIRKLLEMAFEQGKKNRGEEPVPA